MGDPECELIADEMDAEWQAHEEAGRCGDCEMGLMPWYGMAPHRHNWAEVISGKPMRTEMEPRENWPDNFVEDPECPGLGTWYCPRCWKGQPRD